MGNFKFKFSDMMPNSWFYKLKDMNKSKKPYKTNPSSSSSHKTQNSHPKYSHYFKTEDSNKPIHKFYYYNSPINPKNSDTHFPIGPSRKSSITKRKPIYKPSPKLVNTKNNNVSFTHEASHSYQPHSVSSVFYSNSNSNDEDDEEVLHHQPKLKPLRVHFNGCRFDSPENEHRRRKPDERVVFTKPDQLCEVTPTRRKSVSVEKNLKDENFIADKKNPKRNHRVGGGGGGGGGRRFLGSSTRGIKLRGSNSLRVMRRKKKMNSSNMSESLAIVKSSEDPERDFRESMMEMIVENNIRGSKDLEELLACYLALNSNEYHDVIIQAFEQIWFKMHY